MKFEDIAGREDMTNRNSPVTIGANCILEANNQFFLIVEIEAANNSVEINQVIIISITRDQARELFKAGVRRCIVVDAIPTATAGLEIEFKCVFVVGSDAFLVFEVENSAEKIIVVRAPLCPIINQ